MMIILAPCLATTGSIFLKAVEMEISTALCGLVNTVLVGVYMILSAELGLHRLVQSLYVEFLAVNAREQTSPWS